MPVQRALAVVRHEDLHLALRQVFDLLVFRAVFALLSFRSARSFLEALPSKELVPNEGLVRRVTACSADARMKYRAVSSSCVRSAIFVFGADVTSSLNPLPT